MTTRIQIELAEARIAELETLMNDCGFQTKKEFFNQSISLLKWIVRERRKGRSIISWSRRDPVAIELSTTFLDLIEVDAEADQRQESVPSFAFAQLVPKPI